MLDLADRLDHLRELDVLSEEDRARRLAVIAE